MIRITQFAVRQKSVIILLTVVMLLAGIVSWSSLRQELVPDIEFPFVTVTTILRGASPETVETEVTDVLEEQINTIEGIRHLSSTSSEGISQVYVEFELGYDVDIKAQQVREKIAPVRAELPLDIEEPVVTQLDPDASPILSVMLGGPISIRELSEIAENYVSDRLERLAGVGNIEIVAVHTPGHTPEHMAFLVIDHGSGVETPMGMATGDFVFVGDLGRPDLLEKAAGHAGVMEPSARTLHGSLDRFLSLDDHVQVWPGHGAGSACGKALGAIPQSTVGYERRFNAAIDFAGRGVAHRTKPPSVVVGGGHG